ncbi:DNA-3-methyladenine glycosylase 2 family protein [Patescibacteria group bacterium]|nr:DNA-3-methyladenine glycosylase 2 family protein [Patescibacteria group bacterium]
MKKKLYEESLAYLRKDPRLAMIALTEKGPPFKRPADPFHSLIRSIIYQQLSGKAAGTILSRFLTLFPDSRYPTPKEVLTLKDTQLRKVGLSSQKMSYLRDLARRFLDGTIDPSNFKNMTDEKIREHLIVVKGVGRWTADMFLMFTLYRPDVLPTGDLAIQKGFQKLFKMKNPPVAKKMEQLSKHWRPYRTVACWYLWELMDTAT